MSTKKPAAATATFPGPEPETAPIRPEWLASCRIEDTAVVFTFTRDVLLDHLLVTTPGEGRGPTAWSLSASPSADAQFCINSLV